MELARSLRMLSWCNLCKLGSVRARGGGRSGKREKNYGGGSPVFPSSRPPMCALECMENPDPAKLNGSGVNFNY